MLTKYETRWERKMRTMRTGTGRIRKALLVLFVVGIAFYAGTKYGQARAETQVFYDLAQEVTGRA